MEEETKTDKAPEAPAAGVDEATGQADGASAPREDVETGSARTE